MQATTPVQAYVDGCMIVHILAVIDRSLLKFTKGLVDFMDGLFLLLPQLLTIRPLQMSAYVAKI